MRIVLVRHGKPEGVSGKALSGTAIGEWVRHYDTVGISRETTPPSSLRELASIATCVVASDLTRARESAAWLAGTVPVVVDADLREAPLPASLGLSLPLPAGAWIVAARIAWFLNVGEASETVGATRRRASRIVDRLATLAADHECVIAVGHGMFHRFVARELKARGWRGPRSFPGGYWGAATFDRERVGGGQG